MLIIIKEVQINLNDASITEMFGGAAEGYCKSKKKKQSRGGSTGQNFKMTVILYIGLVTNSICQSKPKHWKESKQDETKGRDKSCVSVGVQMY